MKKLTILSILLLLLIFVNSMEAQSGNSFGSSEGIVLPIYNQGSSFNRVCAALRAMKSMRFEEGYTMESFGIGPIDVLGAAEAIASYIAIGNIDYVNIILDTIDDVLTSAEVEVEVSIEDIGAASKGLDSALGLLVRLYTDLDEVDKLDIELETKLLTSFIEDVVAQKTELEYEELAEALSRYLDDRYEYFNPIINDLRIDEFIKSVEDIIRELQNN